MEKKMTKAACAATVLCAGIGAMMTIKHVHKKYVFEQEDNAELVRMDMGKGISKEDVLECFQSAYAKVWQRPMDILFSDGQKGLALVSFDTRASIYDSSRKISTVTVLRIVDGIMFTVMDTRISQAGLEAFADKFYKRISEKEEEKA